MNVVDIHKMLRQIWPNGINPEAYPMIAGMIALDKSKDRLAKPPFGEYFIKGLTRGLATPQRSPTTPLTWERVRAIKADLKEGKLTQVEIAKKFNIRQPSVYQIKIGLIWANDPDETPKPAMRLSRQAPEKLVWAIKALLETQNKTPRTQKGIAKTLKLGPWTVKRALWQLVRDGLVIHKKSVQGPHLYKAV